jgi:hypothetical protein
MKKAIDMITRVFTVLILIDMIGFVAWVMSGQYPTDNFFIGTLTAHFLKLFL